MFVRVLVLFCFGGVFDDNVICRVVSVVIGIGVECVFGG